MSLEYVNRRGDRYFILQGKTKTGKPKYYCSRRAGGVPVERLPGDFQIHENPENGQVSVRKVRPTRILDFKRELTARQANKLAATAVLVDIDGDSLVVYASDIDRAGTARILDMLLGESPVNRDTKAAWFAGQARYSPMLKFTLVDEDERLYSAERYCYRGGVDRWIPLFGAEMPLDALAQRYLPSLGTDDFFDLM